MFSLSLSGTTARLLACIAVLQFCVWASAQEGLAPARAKVAEAVSEQKAMADALATSDESAYNARRAAAEQAAKDAQRLYEQAGVGASKDSDVLAEYARALRLTGDYDLEAKALERAVAAKPDAANLWVALAKAYQPLGPAHDDKARVAIEQAIKLSGESSSASTALVLRGRLLQRGGLYELARQDYEHALRLSPEAPIAQLGLVTLDIREGRMAEAWGRFEKIANSPEVSNDIATDTTDAMRGFDASRRWIPDTADAQCAYAKFLIQASRGGEALAPLKRAATLAPDDYINWNLLGSVAQNLNENELARQAFEKSLALKPDQPRTREALQQLQQSGTGASAGSAD